LKAKLQQAEEAELQQSRRGGGGRNSSQLKSYTGRFRQPGESQDIGRNSDRNLTAERRPATVRETSAAWRKKDSGFTRPSDRADMCDRDESRKREVSAANEEFCEVSSSTEAASSSQTRARKAHSSRKYRYTLFTYV